MQEKLIKHKTFTTIQELLDKGHVHEATGAWGSLMKSELTETSFNDKPFQKESNLARERWPVQQGDKSLVSECNVWELLMKSMLQGPQPEQWWLLTFPEQGCVKEYSRFVEQ